MRHLVTGGLGFIGSHLVDRLLADGHEVVVVDDNRAGNTVRSDCEVIADTVGFMWFEERFAAVWHLASPVGPVGVLAQAGHITGEVFRGAENAIDIAKFSGAPLIHVSTSEVYGGGDAGLCREDMDCRVSASMSARLEYQTAKMAVEVMMRNTVGLDYRIIRPFNVSGPRQRPEGGFVLARWMRQARADQPITVYLPGDQRRAMTHVHDIVDGMVRSWQHGTPGVYNLGNPENVTTMLDLAHLFCEYAGAAYTLVDPTVEHGPEFVEAAEKFPDATKAMTELGWQPTRTLDDIVRDVLA